MVVIPKLETENYRDKDYHLKSNQAGPMFRRVVFAVAPLLVLCIELLLLLLFGQDFAM